MSEEAQPADTAQPAETGTSFEAPHPGSQEMPQWNTADLIEAPTFNWRNWFALLGPGLVMGASAIGGGEWLVGPLVTAKYGGALLWLAALSIFCQAMYNIEISRYTLYTGEPIFTGKFRTLPGPRVWLIVYLLLDYGTLFPYLAASAAIPIEVLFLGQLPDHDHNQYHWMLNKIIATSIFVLSMAPLIFGGKVYNSLKVVMSFKLVFVFAFLLFLAIFYSRPQTWSEILGGFLKVGNVPVQRGEDANGNGRLDPGEDWDGDNRLDVVEESIPPSIDTNGDGRPDDWEKDSAGKRIKFKDIDGDGIRDGDNVENLFWSLLTRGKLPDIDFTFVALIAALAAIAGNGGLSNTPISNFTRDQGWGMGHHVGAIPSMIGGHGIELSHVGSVFEVNEESLPRWKRWYYHMVRDQLAVWVPACLIGVALPSMLSVEFLQRGTETDKWNAAAMTAEGVGRQVAAPPDGVLMKTLGLDSLFGGQSWGAAFWALTLFTGFMVLAPSMAATIDGFIRRWVDVFWTANARLREMEPSFIRIVYFRVLVTYGSFGVVMLWLQPPAALITIATIGYNLALGFSCLHTLVVNALLLPKELRPGWFPRIALMLASGFFFLLGAIALMKEFGLISS